MGTQNNTNIKDLLILHRGSVDLFNKVSNTNKQHVTDLSNMLYEISENIISHSDLESLCTENTLYLIASGKTVLPIKDIRERHNLSLKMSKNIVDKLREDFLPLQFQQERLLILSKIIAGESEEDITTSYLALKFSTDYNMNIPRDEDLYNRALKTVQCIKWYVFFNEHLL